MLSRKRASGGGAEPEQKSAGVEPGIAEQNAVGNAGMLDRMRITEERGSLGGQEAGPLTSAGAGGMRDVAGADAAEAGGRIKDARIVKGQKWGDTFGGGRMNDKGGAGDMGLGRFSRDNRTGGGAGQESSAGDNGLEAFQQGESDRREGQKQSASGLEGMSDKEQEAYFADQMYYGFASQEEANAYAEQVLKESTVAGVPREDDMGGGASGPSPLDQSKDAAKRAGKAPGAAGGAGDGRDGATSTSGRSHHDNINIGVQSGGGVDKERKEVDQSGVSMEAALSANFHTDPQRMKT